MTILEFSADAETLLDYIDQHIRQLSEAGCEAKYILVGPDSYPSLCRAISVRFKRGKGAFETYNYLPIVVDPFRGDAVCVVPAPAACLDGVSAYRIGSD